MPEGGHAIPEITDADIEWVEKTMGLIDLDEPRRNFLKRSTSVDVSACPGSGKTTLVVAKLAMLARKWPHRTKGICVLSHTNVAREEIQRRLGDMAVGQSLLRFPHFIGTIHGFANRFLALPWLKSNGFPSPTVDTDVTTAYRRGVLSIAEYRAIEMFLNKRYSSFDRLRICDRDLNFDLGGKKYPAKPTATTFGYAKKAIDAAANDGYFCHEEMFVWARALLEDFPNVCSWLRCRFPLVLVDEMQDTSGDQGNILHAVFPRTSDELVVQRIGDENQAIFDGAGQEADEISPFPATAPEQRLDISNSFRFGTEIAALAAPFAVSSAGPGGLSGIGPKGVEEIGNCAHSIFVFPDSNPDGVLSAFGEHVLATFDDDFLRGQPVVAVGGVHQSAPDIVSGHGHFPKTVPHYWDAYRAEATRPDSHPSLLIQYFRIAQGVTIGASELSLGVDRIAAGLLRVAGMIGDIGRLHRRARTHRSILEALSGQSEPLAVYRSLLKTVLVDRLHFTQEIWNTMMVSALAISAALGEGETTPVAASRFLAWSEKDAAAPEASVGSNMYRGTAGGRCVDIRVGSIHSVKGQTHLATLLLSTFWAGHWSKKMLPWLLGTKCNANGTGVQNRKRLLQTYVAMTRPSHLMCLAVPRSTFGDADAFGEHSVTLEGRGWRVVELDPAAGG